jgi:hypothetical protein
MIKTGMQIGIVSFALALSLSDASAQANVGGTKVDTAESLRLYSEMHTVLSHPRCVNCHPKDDTPKQGMDSHVHVPPMTRGPDNNGPLGLPCKACHNEANYDVARMPGAPNWHLAPASMAWEGKSAGELCRSMTDPAKNGNRTLAATVKHLTEDKLVAWGWEPGVDVYGNPRQAVPMSKEQFNKTVIAWAKAGAACPE